MAGLLLCIIAIVIGFSYSESRQPQDFNAWVTLSRLVLCAVECFLLGFLASARMKRGMQASASRYRAAVDFARLRRLSWLVVLGLYAVCVHLFDYPYLIRSGAGLNLGGTPLVEEVLVLLPFFVLAVCNLSGLYGGDRLLRGSSWSLWQYQGFYLRQFLVPVFPFLIFSTALDALAYFPGAEESMYVYPSLLTVGYGVFILVLFTLAPFLFRLMWKVERLPDGQLRRRIEEMAASSAVRYGDIYIWHTGGSNMANAMVTGVFGPLRYIFVTDALLALLPEDEVVAVLAHELGHAKHRHMQIYLCLAVSFVALINSADQQMFAAMQWFGRNFAVSMELLYAVYAFGLLVIFWVVIFGFTSRRLEQAADVFASLKVSPAVFGSALERIGFLSGGSRTMGSWRHFSIDKRVRFMEETAAGAGLDAFRRSMKVAFAVVIVVLFLGVGAFSYDVWADATMSPQSRYERRFGYAWVKKDYGRAARIAGAAVRNAPEDAYSHYLLAAALDELGRLEEAQNALFRAVSLDPQEEEYRKELVRLREKMDKRKKENGPVSRHGDSSAE